MSLFFLDHGILKKTLQCDSVTHSGHVSTIFGDSVSLPRKRDISDRLAFDRKRVSVSISFCLRCLLKPGAFHSNCLVQAACAL